jgi:hypothetical protein
MVNHYIENLSGKHNVRFVFTFDKDDDTMNNDEIKNYLNDLDFDLAYYYGSHFNKVEAINDNLTHEDFDILMLCADDIYVTENFDDKIVQEFLNSPHGLDAILQIYTYRWEFALDVFCIMGKDYYDRFNYIYHPSYISEFCDNEYTTVAKSLGKSIQTMDMILTHKWENIKGDATRQRNMDRTLLNKDESNFNFRKSTNFNLNES